MSELYGLVRLGDRQGMAGLLAEMIRSAELPASAAVEYAAQDGMALAVTTTPSDAVACRIFSSNGVTLAISGRLYEDGLAVRGGLPDSEALLALFRSKGAAALAGLNGEYVMAVWESENRRLTLVNDRLGLQPLYWWVAGGRMAFGSTLSCLSELPEFPTSVDEFALGDVLSVGHHLNGRTWYSAAHLLEPASVLSLSDSTLSLRTRWEFEPAELPRSNAELQADFRAALAVAVRHRGVGHDVPIALLLSDPTGSLELPRVVREVGIRSARSFALPMPCACCPSRMLHGMSTIPLPSSRFLSDEVAHLVSPGGLPPLGGISAERRRDQAGGGRPIFLDSEMRQLLRPEVYRAIQGVANDTVERAYRNAPGASPGGKILALRLRHLRHRRAFLVLGQLPREGSVGVPYSDPGVLDLARYRSDVAGGRRRMEPASVLGEFLGGRQGCSTHEWSGMAAVVNRSEEILGEFFRIAPLRELVGRRPADEPGLRDKVCAIVGIAVGLDRSGGRPAGAGFGFSSGSWRSATFSGEVSR